MERKVDEKRAENELDESDSKFRGEFEGKRRILEVERLRAAATELRCKCMGRVFKESLEAKQGLYTCL